MKLKEVRRSDRATRFCNDKECLEIWMDGVKVLNVYDGESEDNNLRRNFSDCTNVLSMLEQAYTAGKNGEDLEIIIELSDDI